MTSLLTSDGAQELLQVFGIVPVRSTAGTDLQRIVWPVFCEKLTQDKTTGQIITTTAACCYCTNIQTHTILLTDGDLKQRTLVGNTKRKYE